MLYAGRVGKEDGGAADVVATGGLIVATAMPDALI